MDKVQKFSGLSVYIQLSAALRSEGSFSPNPPSMGKFPVLKPQDGSMKCSKTLSCYKPECLLLVLIEFLRGEVHGS
jgi:hypothetical protein